MLDTLTFKVVPPYFLYLIMTETPTASFSSHLVHGKSKPPYFHSQWLWTESADARDSCVEEDRMLRFVWQPSKGSDIICHAL